ncbi:hypothetical protein ACOME3_002359 [Neoechinorhynchus agilis]
MWSTIFRISMFSPSIFVKRMYLSKSYYLYDKWDMALQAPVMKSSLRDVSEEISHKLKTGKPVTILELDVLCSKLAYASHIDDVESFHDLYTTCRRVSNAVYVSDSLAHGFIRSHLDINQTDKLLHSIENKVQYGIFLDGYSGNLVMDGFLETENYRGAMHTASEFMLQHHRTLDKLTHAMALRSCVLFMKDWLKYSGENETETVDNSDLNIERVKVNYVHERIFDDHFDLLENDQLLCGKSMVYLANLSPNKLSKTLKVLGYSMWQKFDLCDKELRSIEDGDNCDVDLIKSVVSKSLETFDPRKPVVAQPGDKFRQFNRQDAIMKAKEELVNSLDLAKGNVDVLAETQNELINAVKIGEHQHIEVMSRVIEDWIKQREALFAIQCRKNELLSNVQDLRRRLDEFEHEEEMITFFDKFSEIQMYYADAQFPDEDPAKAEYSPELEQEYNDRYREFYKMKYKEPVVYKIHRTDPGPRIPRFRVGIIDERTLAYSNPKLKTVKPKQRYYL